MRPQLECASCLFKWVYERSEVALSEKRRFQLIRRITAILSRDFSPGMNVGDLSNQITDSIHEFLLQSSKYYQEHKLKSNQLAKELLFTSTNFIEKAETAEERFIRACYLASASNVAPIGKPSEAYKFQEATDILEGKGPLPRLVGDVFRVARRAKHVLYLADNAGEIGLDSLLIAKIKEMGSRVTLIVKEDPFFEDATLKDACFFGLDKLVDEISMTKGFFVPSKSKLSSRKAFKKSDLLISKGTGNYEALKDELDGKKAIFMLKVKCGPIAADSEVGLGSFLVKLDR
ncbi:MAG TPA: ARMT1-like domain-containing protein [Thermodesulfobacteriota bacterium]|nr:ARMT1-like domain-containing protein [Thermodesulfobacteriota bacterium]